MPKQNKPSKANLQALWLDYVDQVYNDLDRNSIQYRQLRISFYAGATVVLKTMQHSSALVMKAPSVHQDKIAENAALHLNDLYDECVTVFKQAEQEYRERN